MTEKAQTYQLNDGDKDWIKELEDIIARIKEGNFPTIIILVEDREKEGLHRMIHGNGTLLLGGLVQAVDAVKDHGKRGGGLAGILAGLCAENE